MKPVSYGNCASTCATKETNGAEVLFANFNFKRNFRYKNTKEWCNKSSKFTNRRCVIRAIDEEGNRYEMDTTFDGKNSVSANVDMLSYDRAYVLQLVEQTSQAKSNSIQLVKYE